MFTRIAWCLGLVTIVAACGGAAEKADDATSENSVGGADTAGSTETTGAVDGVVGTGGSPGDVGSVGATGAGVEGVGGAGGSRAEGAGGATGSGGSGADTTSGESGGSGGNGLGEGGEGGDTGAGGSADLPGFDDLIIQSSVMQDYEGLVVVVAYDHNITVDSRSDNRYALIYSGAFEVSWRQGFNRDTFGAYALLYVDVNDDARCTEDVDPVWWFFVNNPGGEGEPVVAEFDPGPDSPNVSLQEISCETFAAGL